ncbi:hypothetical protein FRB93_005342 [Tulasnella sp. JGI-2019a]|nr:hypothetical protein FRB93_005342 [Tulasnella sp. JGI-2019a]
MDYIPTHRSQYNPTFFSIFASRTRWRKVIVTTLCFLTVYSIIWLWSWKYWILNLTTYSLRPLYDTPVLPGRLIHHLHSPSVRQDDLAACQRHGWDIIHTPKKQKVVDAIIFSVELDLLEIRLAELSPVISHMLILESTSTFTGISKPPVLEPLLHRNSTDQRFRPYLHKIRYKAMKGRPLGSEEHPFDIENEMRRTMTSWIEGPEGGVEDGDLVIMSDVDEIPSRPAITLLSTCAAPSPIHLALSNHLYTFSQTLSPLLPSWRARVTRFKRGQTFYSHGLTTPAESIPMLTDAGWHCSFCFPTIGDFVFKARAFSHTDRLGPAHSAARLLDPEAIKHAVCSGRDFFGMLPEAYDWLSLVTRWKGAGEREGGELPSELVKGGTEKWGWLIGAGGIEVRCRERKWERGDEWKFKTLSERNQAVQVSLP